MIQKVINVLYRHPKDWVKNLKRFGGYVRYMKMLGNQKKMKNAAYSLPVVNSFQNGLPVYFLTGKKYIHQTLFCINSLCRVCNERLKFILVDDGSFDTQLIDLVKSKVTGAEIITSAMVDKNLREQLPADRYPVLHQKRGEYPHIKKLTDIHTLNKGWKMVLDSDMLFWREPLEVISWLKNPHQNIFMKDCIESYGYSINLMQTLCGNEITRMINVGLIGLNSDEISWEKLEEWCDVLEKIEGTSYYLEQALTAMLVAGSDYQILSADYIVNPSINQVKAETGTLHHYVDLSKAHYFNCAWQQFFDGR